MARTEYSGAWVRLPSIPIGEYVRGSGVAAITVVPLWCGMLANLLTSAWDDAPVWVVPTIPIGCILATAAVLAAVLRSVIRGPEVALTAPLLRRPGRVLRASSVRRLVVTRAGKTRDTIVMTTGPRGGAGFPIARAGSSTLDAMARAALVSFLAATEVELPRDPYDPHGHLSRVANPGYLTTEDAVLLVEHPEEIDRFRPLQPRQRGSEG